MNKSLMVVAACSAIVLAGCGAPDGKTMGSSRVEASGGSGLNPIQNYKQERLRNALKGLTYDGAIRVDAKAAAEIISTPSKEGSVEAVREAQKLLEGNDYVAAIGGFTKAVLLDVENAKAYEGLAKALITKGETAKAELALKKAIELAPKEASLYHELAMLLNGRNDMVGATQLWSKALDLDPNMAVAHERLAVIEFYREAYDKAWQHVKRCEALGGEVPRQLRQMLADKMAEPGVPPQR